MNRFKLMIVGICSLGLVACGDVKESELSKNVETVNSEIVENTTSLSNYPEGVQNGLITPEFSDIIHEFMDEYFTYSNTVSSSFKNSQVEDLKDVSSKYVAYLNSINYSPQNDTEDEIYDYFWSAVYHQENLGNYLIKYADTGDKVHKTMAIDEWDSTKADLEILTSILSKYDLFYE